MFGVIKEHIALHITILNLSQIERYVTKILQNKIFELFCIT